jgi:hypothetical protein
LPSLQVKIVKWLDGDWNSLGLKIKGEKIEVDTLDFNLLHDPREDHEIPADGDPNTDI